MNQARKILAAAIGGAMLIFLLYGIVRFPDSPLRPCGDSKYCGKQGQPHTLDEYKAFAIWERVLFWSWAPGILVLLLLRRGQREA